MRIDVVIHPRSLVHSLVEFRDGSWLAQLSVNDMIFPIQYALAYPERWANEFPRLDLAELGTLEFLPLDNRRFPAVELARAALAAGESAPAVLNAANEVAVARLPRRPDRLSRHPRDRDRGGARRPIAPKRSPTSPRRSNGTAGDGSAPPRCFPSAAGRDSLRRPMLHLASNTARLHLRPRRHHLRARGRAPAGRQGLRNEGARLLARLRQAPLRLEGRRDRLPDLAGPARRLRQALRRGARGLDATTRATSSTSRAGSGSSSISPAR